MYAVALDFKELCADRGNTDRHDELFVQFTNKIFVAGHRISNGWLGVLVHRGCKTKLSRLVKNR